MLVQFHDRQGRTYCFRHAVLAVVLRSEVIRASSGESTEVGYYCWACLKEQADLKDLEERRNQSK
mgnify:CR=1 FL=1